MKGFYSSPKVVWSLELNMELRILVIKLFKKKLKLIIEINQKYYYNNNTNNINSIIQFANQILKFINLCTCLICHITG